MDLALKDLGFALAMGEDYGVPLDLAARVAAIFERGRAEYGGGAWSTMIVKLLEDAVGTDLRAPGFPARIKTWQAADLQRKQQLAAGCEIGPAST
jgi:3-hydroxyisobutyrate dehydrogenase